MIRIPIPDGYVDWAKEETKKFDEQKVHDKYAFGGNYIGILSERIFDEWLTKHQVPHTWLKFIKQDYSKPDFIINNHEFDLKCTFGQVLYIKDIKHEYYIFSRVNGNLKTLFVIGFIKGQKIKRLIEEDKLELKQFDDRVNYIVPISEMTRIEEFFIHIFKERDVWTRKIIEEQNKILENC